MLILPLEPTDERADPAFTDAASCAQWLGQLQFTNLHLAHNTLRTQMDKFNRFPVRGQERLRTLELLRETVLPVQADYAKKLFGKKLPLDKDELTVFVAIIGLWQCMVTGYQRCLQAYMSGDKQLESQGAMLCQRCMLYSGLQIFEHQRTGYEFDSRLWQQLHMLYAACEEQGLQHEPVNDGLSGNNYTTSCQAIYIKLLLSCHARPAELTRNQLQMMDRWLTQWSSTVTMDRTYAVSKGDAPPLAVDLKSSHGLQPPQQVPPSDSVRYFAMVPLSKMLRVKMILLQQGQTPQQVGLGDNPAHVDCGDLLNYLHQCWCEGRGTRLTERIGAAQLAQVCYGLDGIYAYIADKPFQQQSGGKGNQGDERKARQQIESFGRVLDNTGRHNLSGMGFALETWHIKDESILGARLLREGVGGERLGPHHIVAMHAADAKAFMLTTVRWISVTPTGQLQMGVRHLPGVPQAIGIKAGGKSAAAILLPPVPALRTPSSLVIPRDWFQAGRPIEILHLDGQQQAVKLGFSVERGTDYERVSYSAA